MCRRSQEEHCYALVSVRLQWFESDDININDRKIVLLQSYVVVDKSESNDLQSERAEVSVSTDR